MPFSALLTFMNERKRLGHSEHMDLDLNGLDGANFDALRMRAGFAPSFKSKPVEQRPAVLDAETGIADGQDAPFAV